MGEMTIHESIDAAGAPVRTQLACDEDGDLALRIAGELWPLPEGALDAVMRRYGKVLDIGEAEMMIDGRLDLGGGKRLVRFRFLSRYDVIARDYLVLYAPEDEPLCELATAVTAALDHLARRLRGLSAEEDRP